MIYGVARTIQPSGPLDGLLRGRFILSYLACTFHGLAKAVTIGWAVYFTYMGPPSVRFEASVTMGFISALFLPQFLMSICTTIGFSVNSFKTIFYHIELLLLPSGIQKFNFRRKITDTFSQSQPSLSLKTRPPVMERQTIGLDLAFHGQ